MGHLLSLASLLVSLLAIVPPASMIGYRLWPLGMMLAIGALVLGIVGLRTRSRHPEARGAVHAIVAIVLGGLLTLVGLALTAMLFVAIVTGAGP